jgi:hypothetical protein
MGLLHDFDPDGDRTYTEEEVWQMANEAVDRETAEKTRSLLDNPIVRWILVRAVITAILAVILMIGIYVVGKIIEYAPVENDTDQMSQVGRLSKCQIWDGVSDIRRCVDSELGNTCYVYVGRGISCLKGTE